MEKIVVKRQIPVKAIVTEGLKRKLAADVQEAIKKLDLELQQLEFSLKKVQLELKADPQRLMAAQQQITTEIKKRQDTRNQLLAKLKEIGRLNVGEEVVQGLVEGLIEVQVGDRWDKVMHMEIVLKDNVVVEIRSPLRES